MPTLTLTNPTVGGSSDSWGTELNTALDAIETWALNAIQKDGSITYTAAQPFAVGTVSLPGITFTGDLNSGLYWISADSIGVAIGGALNLTYAATEITVGTSVRFTAAASTTSRASIKIPPGTAPSSPSDGEIWSDGTNGYWRVGSTTYNLTGGSGGSGVTQFNTRTGAVTLSSADVSAATGVLESRTITAGTGLTGGGSLAANRTISVDAGGIGTTQLANGGVTLAKMANLATNRLIGRVTGSTGVPEALTASEALSILGLSTRLPSAWVEVAITAGIITSQSGYNAVLSIDGTGTYTVTFDSALSSGAYAVTASGQRTAGGGDSAMVSYHSRTSSSFQLRAETPGGSAVALTSISAVVYGPT